MTDRQTQEAIAIGMKTKEAIELARRHCRHMRVELPNGTSFLGSMVGLPIGMIEIRCEHAPGPRAMSMHALNLAVGFYRDNCVGCPHRLPTGEVPNVATISDELARQETEARVNEELAAKVRAEKYRARRQKRQDAVLTQGYVVRDLAEALEVLDSESPRGSDSDKRRSASTRIVETAKRAPELFSEPLIEIVVELASDNAEPAAIDVLGELAKCGRITARAAVEVAVTVLTRETSLAAGRLLVTFRGDVRVSDIAPIVGQLIPLCYRSDDPFVPGSAYPDALQMTADLDLPSVSSELAKSLQADDEWTRHFAADAAGAVLETIPSAVIVLVPSLVASLHGQDEGYAGSAHPTGAANRALSVALRVQPSQTAQLIERSAEAIEPDCRAELVHFVRFLFPWRGEGTLPSDAAVNEAVLFCIRRLNNDWGDDAAENALDELKSLARDALNLVAPHLDALLGYLLELCKDSLGSPLLEPPENVGGEAAFVRALEQSGKASQRAARRRRAAELIGRICVYDPKPALERISVFLSAEVGDSSAHRLLKRMLLLALEEAVNPDLLKEVVPFAYTALLGNEPSIRADGIRLWAACARVARNAMPGNFAQLAQTLLQDNYVVVHEAMLNKLPELRLPPQLAPSLIPTVASWTETKKNDRTVLDDCIESLIALAGDIDDETYRNAVFTFALTYVPDLSPYDARNRLLRWPVALRSDMGWARAALSTLAKPELVDYYNTRHEPLLESLIDNPSGLAKVPLEDFYAVSDVHRWTHAWRAVEIVEIVQTLERWTDASLIAERLERRTPSGVEGQGARSLARLIKVVSKLEQLCMTKAPDDSVLRLAVEECQEAIEEFSPVRGRSRSPSGAHEKGLINQINARISVLRCVLGLEHVTPLRTAENLSKAAEAIDGLKDGDSAPSLIRKWVASTWRIAARLFRYDQAVRDARADADHLLNSALRLAEVLAEEVLRSSHIFVPPAIVEFCERANAVSRPNEIVQAAAVLQRMPLPLPLIYLQRYDRPSPRAARQRRSIPKTESEPFAICVGSMFGTPITDVLVVRPDMVYSLCLNVWLSEWPSWATECRVEFLSPLSPTTLSLPTFTWFPKDKGSRRKGIELSGIQPMHCSFNQPIDSPAIDCPLIVRFLGDGREQQLVVEGYRSLKIRPFDPARDALTNYAQCDERLVSMFEVLTSSNFDIEDSRAFCRLFSACVRAAVQIMFDRRYRRRSHVTEKEFHDDLEKRLKADPELGGRVNRRNAVAGGFDDLLHDRITAELKVERNTPVSVDECSRFMGQPTLYAVGQGSQLSVLVVLDHSQKEAPPGVIENYIGWLQPSLHGLTDPRYPSLVGVLVVNSNLPVPSEWSRKRRTR